MRLLPQSLALVRHSRRTLTPQVTRQHRNIRAHTMPRLLAVLGVLANLHFSLFSLRRDLGARPWRALLHPASTRLPFVLVNSSPSADDRKRGVWFFHLRGGRCGFPCFRVATVESRVAMATATVLGRVHRQQDPSWSKLFWQ